MATFLKLTTDPSGDTIFINVEQVTTIRKIGKETFLFYQGEGHSIVKESPEQIMRMIAQSAPRHWLDHPIDWYRPTWPQPPRETPREPQYGWGPPSVPSGPWCFDHDRWMKAQEDLGHCKDHTNKQTLGIFKDAKEVTSFEQVADFLWPIGVDNPKKEETDEQS